MNKKELVKAVATATEMTQKDAEVVVTAAFDTIVNALKMGEEVAIPNFGKFDVVKVAERTARNPHDGSEVVVPEHSKPRFRASSVLKTAVK